MKIKDKTTNRRLLSEAQIFFKFSFGFGAHNPPKLIYYEQFSWGKHLLGKKDIQLTKKQERWSIAILHHVATNLMVAQMDSVLENHYGKKRFEHINQDIKSAAWIVRLIRNAFTHNPFNPIWLIDRRANNTIYEISEIIKLDTNNLNNRPVSRHDYGGPLALLVLSNFIKKL